MDLVDFEILPTTRGASCNVVQYVRPQKDTGGLDSEAVKVEEKSRPSGWSTYHEDAFQTPKDAAKSISKATDFKLPDLTGKYEKVGEYPAVMGSYSDVWKGKMKSDEGAGSPGIKLYTSKSNTEDVAPFQPAGPQGTLIQSNHQNAISTSRDDEQSGSSRPDREQVSSVQTTPVEPALPLSKSRETSRTAHQQVTSARSIQKDQISVASTDEQSGSSDSNFEQATLPRPTPRESVPPIPKSQENTAQLVAIKILRAIGASRDDEKREVLFRRFTREVRAWRGLDHPNIIPLRGFAFEGWYPCLITPFYKFGHVINYIKQHRHADRTKLIIDIARGLIYLHSLKEPIIHRDIKGTNVLVDDDGIPRLADFGLSKKLQDICNHTTSTIPASYRWMAPELLTGLPRWTKASDVYALSLTALEIYSGTPPFYRIKDNEFTAVLLNHKPPARKDYGRLYLSDSIWQILANGWSAVVGDRPSTTDIENSLRGSVAERCCLTNARLCNHTTLEALRQTSKSLFDTCEDPEAKPVKKALLIGVGYASSEDFQTLSAPRNDVELLQEMLLETGFSKENITILADYEELGSLQATRHNIIVTFNLFCKGLRPNELGFVSFSGHGLPAYSPISERYVNALIPMDGKQEDSNTWITSEELHANSVGLLVDGSTLLVVFDACIWKTPLHLPYEYNWTVGADNISVISQDVDAMSQIIVQTVLSEAAFNEMDSSLDPKGFVLCISSDQKAREIKLVSNGKRYGALTYLLHHCFQRAATRTGSLTKPELLRFMTELHVLYSQNCPGGTVYITTSRAIPEPIELPAIHHLLQNPSTDEPNPQVSASVNASVNAADGGTQEGLNGDSSMDAMSASPPDPDPQAVERSESPALVPTVNYAGAKNPRGALMAQTHPERRLVSRVNDAIDSVAKWCTEFVINAILYLLLKAWR